MKIIQFTLYCSQGVPLATLFHFFSFPMPQPNPEFMSPSHQLLKIFSVFLYLSQFLDFVDIPLPSLDNELLPEDAEATIDIPFQKIQYLKVAYDLLQHPVKKLIANQPPEWIICDFCPYWVVQIAQEFQVNLMLYSVFSASTKFFWVHRNTSVSTAKGKLVCRRKVSR